MDEKQATEITWALWLGGTVGSFAALEIRALLTGRKTLTQQAGAWLGVCPVKPWRHKACTAFAVTCIWGVAHLITGRFSIWFLIPKSRRTPPAVASIHGIED